MKKKLLFGILSITLCITVLGCFIACQKAPDTDNDGVGDNYGATIEYEHEHSYDSYWTSDEVYHWQKATCEHDNEKQNLQSHNFDGNMVCITCGYVRSHTHSLIKISSVSPTCNAAGNMECWQCKECKKYYFDYNCSSEISDIEIKATGHTVSDWIIDVNSNCLNAGLKHKECEVCKTVLQMQSIEKAEHRFRDCIVDEEPT